MSEVGTAARMGKVGVVGAGLMGSEIALVFALAGYSVILADQSEEALGSAKVRLSEIVDKGIARKLYDESARSALPQINYTTSLEDFRGCDLVTEAVFERLETKSLICKRLDAICRPDCIIATNTSTIPIAVLASAVDVARRGRFIGTHYFSPVSRMRLVEVIPGIETDECTIETVCGVCRGIGKTPVLVRDVPGFAVNRLLHVLMIEAVRLVEEGVSSPEDIDLACRLGLGHPMGPFELMDATTSSLCLEAQQIMFEAYGERFRPRPLLKQRVQAGYIGGRDKPGWRSTKKGEV